MKGKEPFKNRATQTRGTIQNARRFDWFVSFDNHKNNKLGYKSMENNHGKL